MPCYEYACEKHGHVVAVLMPMNEPQPKSFPADEVEAAPVECVRAGCLFKRIMSTFGGHFGDTPTHHH